MSMQSFVYLILGGRTPSFEESSLTSQAESGRMYMLFRTHWYQSIFGLGRRSLVILCPIVVLSRLAYRKGIDLLVATAPHICSAFPNVRFVVGGDGPKLVDLLQMREKHNIQDRIELLGTIRPIDVRYVLMRGPNDFRVILGLVQFRPGSTHHYW
ncbi:hypothetical protein ARMSODRAFT_1024061 [Armillaria solidipes]|uniref:Glycosyl transferase family 1 domain-containing protein n=1 Tax=Armillaria solidipes TaxID=1076256 RepID=A0A2H3AXC9_9AGAR|nr:hypothetical protein ARMSODRAFT_1024061 [Armillaria solidipes]